jgi:pimeloyl-ACP methyl ester carboxylesterase
MRSCANPRVAAVASAILLVVLGFPSRPAWSQSITQDGRLVVPEARTQQWSAGVGNRELIESTYARITRLTGATPGSWPYEWMHVASAFERQGRAAAERGQAGDALQAYLKASLYYAIGYFPDNATPEQQASYRNHLATYVAASRFFGHTMEVVSIPLDGAAVTVHLHVPPRLPRPALVLWNGGSDWWKASYHGAIEMLVRRGFAVAAFDLPGTGESTAWVLGADGGRLHARVLDVLQDSGRFDFGRVGIVGVSLGGNYAVRTAALERRVKAAVNFCGPIHSVFQMPAEARERVTASAEGGPFRASARAGLDPRDPRPLGERLDLVALGVVGPGTRIDIPVLSVNGTRDFLAPVEDLELVRRSSPTGEAWLLGTSGHCAVEYTRIVWPQVVEWLAEKLSDGRPR